MSDNTMTNENKILARRAAELTARIPDETVRAEAYSKVLRQLTTLYRNNVNRGFSPTEAADMAFAQFGRLINASKAKQADEQQNEMLKAAYKAEEARTPSRGARRPNPTEPEADAREARNGVESASKPSPEAAARAAKQRKLADKPQKKLPFFKRPAFVSQAVIYLLLFLVLPFAARLIGDAASSTLLVEFLFYFVGPAVCASCGAVITFYCGIDPISMLIMPVLFVANLLIFHNTSRWVWILCYAACFVGGVIIGVGINALRKSARKEK